MGSLSDRAGVDPDINRGCSGDRLGVAGDEQNICRRSPRVRLSMNDAGSVLMGSSHTSPELPVLIGSSQTSPELPVLMGSSQTSPELAQMSGGG
jgi:hypothetical protein